MLAGSLAFVVMLLCSQLVNAQTVQVSFSGNVTASASDNRFNWRHTTFGEASFGSLAGGVYYDSIQGSASQGTANLNGVAGFAYSLKDFYHPTVLLAFFNESGTATGFGQATFPWSVSLSGSLSVVATVYYQIQEMTSSGTVVNSYPLNAVSWTYGQPTTVDATRGLQTVTVSASIGSTGKVYLTYAVSSVLGVVNPGNVVITPTMLEAWIEIDNYPYASSSNYLVLTCYTAHLAASTSTTANGVVVAGSGASQVYIKFSGTATISGSSKTVTVNGLGTVTATSNLPQYIANQFSSHGSLDAEAREITIQFPAGASSIVYDPSIGFGEPPSNGAVSGFGANTFSLLFSVFIAIFLAIKA